MIHRFSALALSLILVSMTLSGCISSDENSEKKYIDDDSELNLLEADFCGDLDGDGELDCPLSGYIPDTTPWWCNSSGIGGHHVDPAYDGMNKAPLSNDDCETLTEEFQDAIEWASQWPTLGDAENSGFHMLVGYTEGMGTHHARLGNFSMSDEQFDSNAPEFIGTTLDTEFDHSKPEFLMYSGESQDSELVGFAWYVQAPSDTPPAGFTGDNDWWHRHDSLCFKIDLILVLGENIEEEECSDRGGENVLLDDFWMSHAWVIRPWLTHEDVFTNHHPCLAEEGAIEDTEDECWGESMGHVGHDIE
jgi:hypothetical protein